MEFAKSIKKVANGWAVFAKSMERKLSNSKVDFVKNMERKLPNDWVVFAKRMKVGKLLGGVR